MGRVGRLISILLTTKKFWFRNVSHHFQTALLPAVESLITFTSCGGQLTQVVSTFSQLSIAAAKTSSSWYHSKSSSLLNMSQWVSQSVSEWVSDKHNQWLDSGPIKMNFQNISPMATVIWRFQLGCNFYQARARSARARRACALRALGLLLADGAPTVGGRKTFWRVN